MLNPIASLIFEIIVMERFIVYFLLFFVLIFFKSIAESEDEEFEESIASSEKNVSIEDPVEKESFWTNIIPFIYLSIFSFLFWTFLQIGVTPQDVIRGVPLHKYITKISWPAENQNGWLSVCNTISVSVVFRYLNGQNVKNPSTNGK